MKKFLQVIIFCLIAALVCGGISSVAFAAQSDEPVETLNDYDATAWKLGDGMTAQVLSDGGKKTSVAFASEPGHEYSLTYLNESYRQEFMIDFCVGLSGAADGAKLFLTLSEETATFAEIELDLSGQSYDALLWVGNEYFALRNALYGENGRIQIRLAYDNLLDYQTYTREDGWNFVAGCDKATNLQATPFEDEDYATLTQKLLPEGGNLAFTMRAEGFTDGCRVELAQIGNACFYDYYLFSSPRLTSDDAVYYNRASIEWTLPDSTEFPRGGFRVERYKSDSLDGIYTYDNAFATSISETQLKQNTVYTYRVTAFSEVDGVSNAVACYRVCFKYSPFEVKTLKGNFAWFVIFAVALIAVLAAVILLYVYFYDIKAFLKRGIKKKHV